MLDPDATISALAADPARTAVLLDFDGSIAAIVPHADDARPVAGALPVLQRLAGSMGLVAIVSGRPVGFLAERVPVERVMYVGLYGMERIVNGIRFVDPRVSPYVDTVALATAEAQSQLPVDLVEPKSGLSVTLHWRPAPELAGEMVATAERLAEKYGLAVLRTRMAIEIRPPIDIDKGEAVRSLVDGYETAAYSGDDYGDIPAFVAMQAAAGDGDITHGIRIGVRSPEMPPEVVDVTDVLVDGPEGLVALLARVADEIGEPVAG